MNRIGFTLVDAKGREWLCRFFSLCALLILPGCMASTKTAPLAPNPPVLNLDSTLDEVSDYQLHYFIQPTEYSNVEPSAEVLVEETLLALHEDETPQQKCRLKDRFDRDALLAYEWDRSRFAMDVDGINMSGSGDAGMRLEYKIRLQPEKTKKQKCRYNAKWQGLIGSGYNELMVREDDTVWKELREKRSKMHEFIGVLF